MPGAANYEPEYVAARRVLLDVLEALNAHRKAVILVGAQAIYLHVGEGDLAVSPYTTDGDLSTRASSTTSRHSPKPSKPPGSSSPFVREAGRWPGYKSISWSPRPWAVQDAEELDSGCTETMWRAKRLAWKEPWSTMCPFALQHLTQRTSAPST